TTRMTPKMRASPMLMRAYTPPTSSPVTTYWVTSLATTGRRDGALLVPHHRTRRQADGDHRERLAVLPLHDQGNGADPSPALVEPDAPGVERCCRGAGAQVDLGERVANLFGIGRLPLLDRFLEEPDVRVGAQRILGHEGLARPLHEPLHQLLLTLDR